MVSCTQRQFDLLFFILLILLVLPILPVPLVSVYLYTPHCAEKRAVAFLLQHIDRLLGQRRARPLERLEAGIEVNERELESGGAGEGFENLTAGLVR